MKLNNDQIKTIAGSILKDNEYLFPSTYPDIPLNLSMLKTALSNAGITAEKNEVPDLMQRVELALAAMVPLNWNNYGSIAILLEQEYPDEDLITINMQRIIELTRSLSNFEDDSVPDQDQIDSIIYTWISLTDEEIDMNETESWS